MGTPRPREGKGQQVMAELGRPVLLAPGQTLVQLAESWAGEETVLHPRPYVTPACSSSEALERAKLNQRAEETYKSALMKPFPSVSNTLKAWRIVSSGSVPRSNMHETGTVQG